MLEQIYPAQTLSNLQVINGENQKVYFHTDTHSVYMDTLFTIQFGSSAATLPINSMATVKTVDYYSTPDILSGIMVFNQFVLNPFEMIDQPLLEDVDGNKQLIYYINEIEIQFIEREIDLSRGEPEYKTKGTMTLHGIYASMPSITIIADSQPLQLVSRFVVDNYEIFK